MKYVSKSGTWKFNVSGSESRADTPLLEVENLTPGNTVIVTANFSVSTGASTAEGVYFRIAAVNADEVTALTPAAGLVQAIAGWTMVSLVGLFHITETSKSPTEDIDFEVLFSKGDLAGKGRLHNFTLTADVVSTTVP